MKEGFLFCLLIFIFCQMIFAQDNASKKFALYLLPDNIKPNQLSNLKTLKPRGKPFIASENIWFYQKDTHEFQVDYIVAERLKKLQVGAGRKYFAVFVGDEAIYTGAFTAGFSSKSDDGIVIDKTKYVDYSPFYHNPDFPILSIELGYPTTSFFKGTDLRSDSRIVEALKKAGLLYEDLNLLVTCKNIKSTMKRHQSYVFTFAVEAVEKGKFEKPEINIELYSGFGGGKMRSTLKSFDAPYDEETAWKFNENKKILLKFLQQIAPEKPKLILKGFDVK